MVYVIFFIELAIGQYESLPTGSCTMQRQKWQHALMIFICVFSSKKDGVHNIAHYFFVTPNNLSIAFLAFVCRRLNNSL